VRLELINSLSLPGNPDKPNEDAFAHNGHMAAVFDGVTGLGENLMPGGSDAAWLARFGARRLAAHSEDGGNPRYWIKSAAEDAAKSFAALRRRGPKERYEISLASLMLVSIGDNTLEAVWLGDCSAIVRMPDVEPKILGDAVESRARERQRVADMASSHGLKPAAKVARQEFLPELRAKRNLVNTAEGAWLFAPDPKCAKHVRTTRTTVASGAVILLATDGFLALVSDYERYTPASLFAAAENNGLASLGAELRAIEAADPEGVRYPRFKENDDATAIIMRAVP